MQLGNAAINEFAWNNQIQLRARIKHSKHYLEAMCTPREHQMEEKIIESIHESPCLW